MSELDKAGEAFDPAIHYAKDGKGVLTKAGVWRRRPGGAPKGGTDVAALVERLDRQQREIERLQAAYSTAPAAAPTAADIKRLQATIEELGSLHPNASRQLARPAGTPNFVPYRGLARAKEKCATDGFHEPGDIFSVDVPCLWSDDPFEPIIMDGDTAVPNPNAPDPVDFRFRQRVDDSTQNLQARAV